MRKPRINTPFTEATESAANRFAWRTRVSALDQQRFRDVLRQASDNASMVKTDQRHRDIKRVVQECHQQCRDRKLNDDPLRTSADPTKSKKFSQTISTVPYAPNLAFASSSFSTSQMLAISQTKDEQNASNQVLFERCTELAEQLIKNGIARGEASIEFPSDQLDGAIVKLNKSSQGWLLDTSGCSTIAREQITAALPELQQRFKQRQLGQLFVAGQR